MSLAADARTGSPRPGWKGARAGGVLATARGSLAALVLAVTAWTTGCATGPKPAIEPAFAARSYTPLRITLLPPDLFLIVDQVGQNDPAQSEALRQKVYGEIVRYSTEALRARGYDVDLSARWDGIVGRDGTLLVSRDEMGWMANSVLQFANGPSGGRQGPLSPPEFVAPEIAAKIGWATQSDALLYVNLKGVTTTDGKRAAQIVGGIFIVVIIAAIIVAVLASAKGGSRGGSGSSGLPGMKGGRSVAAPPTRGAAGSAMAARPATPAGGGGLGAGMLRGAPPVGRGLGPVAGRPGRVYGGGGPHVGVGVGIYVPLGPVDPYPPVEGPTYTHDGSVTHDDEFFGGDQLYVSMTLVNAADGRVLWHLREDLDLDADDPRDVQTLVNRLTQAIPLRGGLPDPGLAGQPAAKH